MAVAWLLLLAQLHALLFVPLHTTAHAGKRPEAVSQVATNAVGPAVLGRLLGHDQGSACDDWNAAFALDSNPGSGSPLFESFVPAGSRIAFCSPADPRPAPALPFLARAPPRA
jgi:hypothetical protein